MPESVSACISGGINISGSWSSKEYSSFVYCMSFFFANIKEIWDLEQQHSGPADCAGEGDAGNAEDGRQQVRADGAEGGLDKGAEHRSIHFSHSAEKALHSVCHCGQQIEECHISQVFAA